MNRRHLQGAATIEEVCRQGPRGGMYAIWMGMLDLVLFRGSDGTEGWGLALTWSQMLAVLFDAFRRRSWSSSIDIIAPEDIVSVLPTESLLRG